MLSVIITTRDRPEFLRTALESVRAQTARARIGQVVVSENGLTNGSRDLCNEFSDLPVEYVKQEPPVPSLLHPKALWKHVRYPLIAILHDDDWWAPNHLEDALVAFDEDASCVATFSNFLDTWGEETVPGTSQKAWRAWVATECNFAPPLLYLDQTSVLLGCLLESTFHYSTMVVKSDVFWEAYLRIVAAENHWDNERTFPVFLSDKGRVGYLTRHHAYIRNHPGQEGAEQQFVVQGRDSLRVQTTRWLLAEYPEAAKLAKERFNRNVVRIREHFLWIVSSQIEDPQKATLIAEAGLNLMPTPSPPPHDLKWFLKQLCPPLLLNTRKQWLQSRKRKTSHDSAG